jgi:RNA polymerase-binding transcription factor DksA
MSELRNAEYLLSKYSDYFSSGGQEGKDLTLELFKNQCSEGIFPNARLKEGEWFVLEEEFKLNADPLLRSSCLSQQELDEWNDLLERQSDDLINDFEKLDKLIDDDLAEIEKINEEIENMGRGHCGYCGAGLEIQDLCSNCGARLKPNPETLQGFAVFLLIGVSCIFFAFVIYSGWLIFGGLVSFVISAALFWAAKNDKKWVYHNDIMSSGRDSWRSGR